MDLYQAEAARGWYKWIYIRQRQPGVGINRIWYKCIFFFFLKHIRQRQPGGWYKCQDLNQAEAEARGWYKWIYIRQRQPGVGIEWIYIRQRQPGVGINGFYIRQRQPGVGINGFISGRGSPGLV